VTQATLNSPYLMIAIRSAETGGMTVLAIGRELGGQNLSLP
jgi:hypothetical protein